MDVKQTEYSRVLAYLERCSGTRFLKNQGKWTCHITVLIDMYELGDSKEEAFNRLVNRVWSWHDARNYILENHDRN